MYRSIFVFILLITSLLGGCARFEATPAREPLKAPLPTLEIKSEWTIKMTHSGGIMGVMRSIEISLDGNYTINDGMLNKTVTDKLSTSELAELQEIVSKTKFITPERSAPSGCADCFIYELETQKDGKRFKIQLDDMSMQNSGMETLITYLRELMDTALK